MSVRIVTGSGVTSFARAQDLSITGMSVYAPLELEAEDRIRAEFTLPNSRVKLSVAGVVKNRTGFRYGIAFIDLAEKEAAEIARVTDILALTQT